MQGYTTNYVNLITDNLRDRYESGFPILKELIQNADDAKARSFVFAQHPGFAGAAHPLLQGPGLWFFNDGEFKESDARALRSFGINTKAADTAAIGKFGLGMKSVFHLCEALFYVASDGTKAHREGLTPWKQDDENLHPEWEASEVRDWQGLEDLALGLADDSARGWFLLWVPLRRRAHLYRDNGEQTGAIISRFPGDEPDELRFLEDEGLALQLAEILPLLRHLERIEHHGAGNHFSLRLEAPTRLLSGDDAGETAGRVLSADGDLVLRFAGQRRADRDAHGIFAALKARDEWPRSRYRDENGHEQLAEDKTAPEGAVLFCRASAAATPSNLHWAVFLPVDLGGEQLRVKGGDAAHSLILHGQFFVDAGRKKIHDLELLGQDPQPGCEAAAALDDSLLRRTWNQHLAQRVLLPEVIPTFEHYVADTGLSEAKCEALTRALADSTWFKTFRPHICRTDAWIRALNADAKPGWQRVHGADRERLRPLPNPPQADPSRPWCVFPRLAKRQVIAFDRDAPSLTDRLPQWQEAELDDLLGTVTGLFVDGPKMDYCTEFLDRCAQPFLSAAPLQGRLVTLLRAGLRDTDQEGRRRLVEKGRRLLGFVAPERRLGLAAELPDAVLRSLWEVDAPILLVPAGLDCEPKGKAEPDDATLRAWLLVLDRHLPVREEAADELKVVLAATQGLVKSIDSERRGRFLRVHADLRIIAVRDAGSGRDRAVSCADISAARSARTLFGFGQGTQERERLGLTPLLARTLPGSAVWLVRADAYQELFPGEASPPRADSGPGCLVAVASHATGCLGPLDARRALLEKANDPSDKPMARRGLRYLLHACAEQREADDAVLWFPGHEQHSAWTKLWGQLHRDEAWSLVPAELADTLPRSRWAAAGAQEIDAHNLVQALQRGRGITAPTGFTADEREEILSKIDDQELWQRLPLHTALSGEPVSAGTGRVYLAPEGGTPDDPLVGMATLIARSHHSVVAAQQRRWLAPLDDCARIAIALGDANPAMHWQAILDALGRLGTATDAVLVARLREAAWLPTGHGEPVKPEDVIDLEGGLADQVQRLVAEHRAAHGRCFAVPEELSAALQQHPAWADARMRLLSHGEVGLAQLALLLADLPTYRIGAWTTEPDSAMADLLARCPSLPGWRLWAQAADAPYDPAATWLKLRSGLAQTLDPERIAATLDWLSTEKTDWVTRKSAFDAYLRWFAANTEFARRRLRRLRLASRAGDWRAPEDLCADAYGVAATCQLDRRQTEILGDLIHRADHWRVGSPVAAQPAAPADRPPEFAAAQAILADYFRAWGPELVPPPMIGVLLGLLGRGVRRLAEEHLRPHSFEWLLDQLPWTDPGGDAMRTEWMGGKTRQQALDLIEAACEVALGNEIEVPNLLGATIRVPLTDDVATLLAGAPRWKGGYRVLLILRHVDPAGVAPEQPSELLRATAEDLYAALYNQRRPDFTALWRELDRSDQLEIGVARRLILDHIPFYLRQLATDHPALRGALTQCDERRRRVAEVEAGGSDAGAERRAQAQAIEELAGILENDESAGRTVLAGVKAKLLDFQYDAGSILFELFQNADDAAVELGQIEAYASADGEVPDGARPLVVEVDEAGVRLMHWGRAINACGPVVFDGARRGFGRDLEKMLVLSASDKLAEQGLTGKFGLGFKSVLLACDRPRIVSGRLALEVVAGILPQPWEDAAAARDALTRHTPGGLRLAGTLIDLPGVSRDTRRAMLERFVPRAGVLCAFARAIRSVRVYDPDAQASAHLGDLDFSWRPALVRPGIEHGRLCIEGEWGSDTDALCLRTDSGALLFALGPGGFRPLPFDTPTLWVTAPLREAGGIGFAINGRFDIDAGRARLAGDSARNVAVARHIGAAAGDALGALFNVSRDEWDVLRLQLGLAADLSAHDFWHSLWLRLTEGWLRRSRIQAGELARELALALLKSLSTRPGALPNGLSGPLQGMVTAIDVRYELPDALATEAVIAVLSGWRTFAARYPKEHLVCAQQGAILKHGDLARPATVDFSALVALAPSRRVGLADAEALGTILRLTDDDASWQSPDLKRRLQELQFRTAADTWADAGRLVAGAKLRVEKDELLRYDLAPPDRRLHPDYWPEGDAADAPALAFFLLARQRLQAGTEELVHWVKVSHTEDARRAALVYLSDGELGERVAELVRYEGWVASALDDAVLMARVNREQHERLRRRLMSRSQLDTIQPPGPAPKARPRMTLPDALGKLADRWREVGAESASTYRARLYPAGELKLRRDPDTGDIDRSSWLTLFALGTFQSIGRTREFQHRGFIEHCRRRNWWQIFADIDPKQEPERWMEVIEAYAEDQHDDEQWTQWIAQFPKLYRLRRWMDDYVELFLSIDRFAEPFRLDSLLTPRANPHFQGGGTDAPPLNRTLRVGGSLIVRELLHHRVISNPLAVRHAYAPVQRIIDLFARFDTHIESSEEVYELLKKYLGEADATFGGSYDIPLRLAADDEPQLGNLWD